MEERQRAEAAEKELNDYRMGLSIETCGSGVLEWVRDAKEKIARLEKERDEFKAEITELKLGRSIPSDLYSHGVRERIAKLEKEIKSLREK